MIYIDLTRLINWQGNYTGMERFAYEITTQLLSREQCQPCAHVKGVGFVSLGEAELVNDQGRLKSINFRRSSSLKALLVQGKPRTLLKELHKRVTQVSGTMQRLEPTHKDTLLIYDGLWDDQEYIDEVLAAAKSGVHLAHVVHDLVPIVMPQACLEFVTTALSNYFEQIAPSIDTLFSISKNTERDFIDIYGDKTKKSLKKVIIRHGEDFTKVAPKKPGGPLENIGDFILTVGTVEVRKNHQLLYQAYRLAQQRDLDLPKLVIVGRDGWMSESVVRAMKQDPAVKDKFVFAGPVDDAGLAWLYEHCLYTAFPAVYEGWGLPVAESLYYGKVCAASSASSIPEIGGDLNLYYSPYDAAECLGVLAKLSNAQERSRHEKTILEKYKKTSWRQTADAILTAIS